MSDLPKPHIRARAYADDVAAGRILACKWVRLAAERFIRDMDRAARKDGDFPYFFDMDMADRAISFMEKMPHIKGKWAAKGQKITFEPWQCFAEANIFGWRHKETGLRRFNESFELIPRKNAKSTRKAAAAIYMFCADKETGAEIYSGATTEKQAFEVYRPAWLMVNKTPPLKTRFDISQAGTLQNPGPMFVLSDMSKFEPLIGKPGDGASPHLAIIDEYHEHDSDQMVQVMQTGMGAREQPLLCIISTAGSNLAGPCYERQQDMQRLLEGNIQDDRIFAIIYGIDDGDEWDSEESLIKANPNYNISVFSDFLLSQQDQARRSATKQNAFRTKHLNEWVGAKTAWMNMLAWQRQIKKIDGRCMVMDDFADCPARVSADLSSRKDVSAIDVTFQRGDEYFSFKKFFAPESAAEENERYRDFVLDGCLELTDGSMIDQEAIESYILDINKRFNVIDNNFDEWQADYMMTRLQNKKLDVVKFPFNVRNISEPMKAMEALVLEGKYWHDGNAMMTWMMGNVAARLDIRGNIFPNKARAGDPRCKIDGIAAALMSLGRFIIEPPPEKKYQVYVFGPN